MFETRVPFSRRFVAVLLCAMFVFAPVFVLRSGLSSEAKKNSASYLSERNKLQQQLEDARLNSGNLNSQLNSQAAALLETEELRQLQFEEIEALGKEIELLDQLIQSYFLEIEEKNQQMEELTLAMKESFDLFCERLVFMQESGTEGYLDFLFNSESFSDFLSRGEIMNDFLQYDRDLINGLMADYERLEISKEEIALLQKEYEARKLEFEEQTIILQAKIEVYNQTILDYEQALEQIRKDYDESKALESKLEKDRDYAEQLYQEALKQEQAANSPSGNTTPGSNNRIYQSTHFPNPLAGSDHYKSQPFNYGHGGVDLATRGKGVPIKASLGGTVIESGYHWSWGYYVKIDHGAVEGVGNEVYTLYAHMVSAPAVSVGQKVSGGTYLGTTGNTGNSYGVHLHFEVYLGGKSTAYRVNPEKY